jgi:hypothetical protein
VAKHYYSEYGLGSQSGADPLNATQGYRRNLSKATSTQKSGTRPKQKALMWIRLCKWCSAELAKHHLSEVLKCSCGWIWR